MTHLQFSAAEGCHFCYLRWEHIYGMTSESERLAIRNVSYSVVCLERPVALAVNFLYDFNDYVKSPDFYSERQYSLIKCKPGSLKTPSNPFLTYQ
jgi:hypothetical protein